MSGKDTARKILNQLFNSNLKPQPNIIKVEARFIEDLTPEVKNELVKIAYNTYVKKSDLSRVWTIERIDGKDYVVAVDSGRQLSYNYDIKHSDSDIQIVRGDEVLASFPVDELTDVKGLASFLRNKAAMYKFLPSQLFVQAMRNDFESFKKVFISSNALMRKSAAGNLAAIIIRNNEKSLSMLKNVIAEGVKDWCNSIFYRVKGTRALNEDIALKLKSIIDNEIEPNIKDRIIEVLDTVVKSSNNQDIIFSTLVSEIKVKLIQYITELKNKISQEKYTDEQLVAINNYIDYLKDTTFQQSLALNIAIKYTSMMNEAENKSEQKKEDSSKEISQKVREDILTERQRLERDIRSRSGKLLGYIEGANSYVRILRRLEDERKNLKNELHKIIDTLGDYINIEPFKGTLYGLIDKFIESPLDITKDQVRTELQSVVTSVSEKQLDSLVYMISAGFSRVFFEAIKTFFAQAEYNLLSQSLLGKLFYQFDDPSSIARLESSDIPDDLKNYVGYLETFNELSRSNDKFDVVLAKFLDRDLSINTKDKIFSVLQAISSLVKIWTNKVAGQLYNRTINISNIPQTAIGVSQTSSSAAHMLNFPNVILYEFSATHNFIDDLLKTLIVSLSVKAKEVLSKVDPIDIGTEEGFKKLVDKFTTEDRKILIIALLKLAFLGRTAQIQSLAVTPQRILESYGKSQQDEFNEVIEELTLKLSDPNAANLGYTVNDITELLDNLGNLDVEDSPRKKLNPIAHSILVQLLRINPKFVLNYLKDPDPDLKINNPLDQIKLVTELLKKGLKSLIEAINNLNSTVNNTNAFIKTLLEEPKNKKEVFRAFPLLAMKIGIPNQSNPNIDSAVGELAQDIFDVLASDIILTEEKHLEERERIIKEIIEKWEAKYAKFGITVDTALGVGAKDLINALAQINISINSIPDLRKNIHAQFILKHIIETYRNQQGRFAMIGIPNIMTALLHKSGFIESLFGKYIGPASAMIQVGTGKEMPFTSVNLGTPTSPYSTGERSNPVILARKLYEVTGFPNYFIENYLLANAELKKIYDHLSAGVRSFTPLLRYHSNKFNKEWDLIYKHVSDIVTKEKLAEAYNAFLEKLKTYLPSKESKDDKDTLQKYLDPSKLGENPNIISQKMYNEIEKEKNAFLNKLYNTNRVKAYGNTTIGDEFLNDVRLAFASALHTEILCNQPEAYQEDILYFKSRSTKLLKQSSSSIPDDPLSLITAVKALSNFLNFSYHCANLLNSSIKVTTSNKKFSLISPASTGISKTGKNLSIKEIADIFQAFKQSRDKFSEKMKRLEDVINSSALFLFQLVNIVNFYGRHYGKFFAMLYDAVVPTISQLMGLKRSHIEGGTPKLDINTQIKLDKLLRSIIDYGNSLEGQKEFFDKMYKQIETMIKAYENRIKLIDRDMKQITDPSIKKELQAEKDTIVKNKMSAEAVLFHINEVRNFMSSTPSSDVDMQKRQLLEHLNAISTLSGLPIFIELKKIDPDTLLSNLIPKKVEDMTLRAARLVEKLLGIDSKLIDGLVNVLGTTAQLKATLTLASEKITVPGPNMTYAKAAELGSFFALTPVAQMRAKIHTSSGVYVLSENAIKFLHEHLPPDIYDALKALVNARVSESEDFFRKNYPAKDRMKLLSDILKIVLPYRDELYQHDISSLFDLLDVKIDGHNIMPQDIDDMFSNIATEVAKRKIVTDTDVYIDTGTGTLNVNNPDSEIVESYKQILYKYFNGTLNSYTILREIFDLILKNRPELIDVSTPGKSEVIQFRELWHNALLKVKAALEDPENQSSYAEPYLINYNIIQDNINNMKGHISKISLDATFTNMENIRQEKSASSLSGQKGTNGSMLSELLYAGQYNKLLKAKLDRLAEIVLPKIIEQLDENDMIQNFPASELDKKNYGLDIDISLFRESMSGFLITLFGILIDSYIDVAINGVDENGLRSYLGKYLPSNPTNDFVIDLICDLIFRTPDNQILEVMQVFEREREREREHQERYKKSSYYRDEFNYSLIKISETEEFNQNTNLNIKDLEAKVKSTINLLSNQIEYVNRLFDEANQINKELEEEIVELENNSQ